MTMSSTTTRISPEHSSGAIRLAAQSWKACMRAICPTAPASPMQATIHDLPHHPPTRILSTSRIGGAPNIREYSRLNCDTL